jgi:hypothetical protein
MGRWRRWGHWSSRCWLTSRSGFRKVSAGGQRRVGRDGDVDVAVQRRSAQGSVGGPGCVAQRGAHECLCDVVGLGLESHVRGDSRGVGGTVELQLSTGTSARPADAVGAAAPTVPVACTAEAPALGAWWPSAVDLAGASAARPSWITKDPSPIQSQETAQSLSRTRSATPPHARMATSTVGPDLVHPHRHADRRGVGLRDTQPSEYLSAGRCPSLSACLARCLRARARAEGEASRVAVEGW